MSKDELIALALAGVALWMVFSSKKSTAAVPTSSNAMPQLFASLSYPVMPIYPAGSAYGWTYRADGTAVSPNGVDYPMP